MDKLFKEIDTKQVDEPEAFLEHKLQLCLSYLTNPLVRDDYEEGNFTCDCPGIEHHSCDTALEHTIVYCELNEAITVHCVHQSCAEELQVLNHTLRSAWGVYKNTLKNYIQANESGKGILANKLLNRMRDLLNKTYVFNTNSVKVCVKKSIKDKQDLKLLLQKTVINKVSKEQMEERLLKWKKPDGLSMQEQTLFHLSLFKGIKGNICIGSTYHSGEKYKNSYKPFDEWYNLLSKPYGLCNILGATLITQSTFSSYYRRKEDIIESAFVVFESDTMAKEDAIQTFSAISEFLDLDPLLILDSGGKSLHAWFNRQDLLSALDNIIESNKPLKESDLYKLKEDPEKLIALIAGCWEMDPAAVRTAQPVRMAGLKRDNGEYQKIIYFNEK